MTSVCACKKKTGNKQQQQTNKLKKQTSINRIKWETNVIPEHLICITFGRKKIEILKSDQFDKKTQNFSSKKNHWTH